jgi:hypothetical protein
VPYIVGEYPWHFHERKHLIIDRTTISLTSIHPFFLWEGPWQGSREGEGERDFVLPGLEQPGLSGKQRHGDVEKRDLVGEGPVAVFGVPPCAALGEVHFLEALDAEEDAGGLVLGGWGGGGRE